MKKKTGVLLSLLTIAVLYLFFSTALIVRPGKVAIVRELEFHSDGIALVDRAYINSGDRSRLFFKQPTIPGTGIGYIDEIYNPGDPYSFKTSFALYTLDQLTGNMEDRDKVRAYTISGTIGEINDWENFLGKLNIEEVNRNRSPYSRQYESRVEILAEQLKFLLRTSSPEQYYPYGAGTEEKVMNLGQKISWLQQELVSRRNFLAAIQDKYNFTEAEYYRQFLMNRAPWYWVMGVDRYEELVNHVKNLREYEQSVYSDVISRRGSANKYVADEDYLYLINMMGKVHYYEQSLLNNEETLDGLQLYLDQIYREIAPSDIKTGRAVSRGFLTYLRGEGKALVDIDRANLDTELYNYVNSELIPVLEQAINYRKLLLNIDYLQIYESQILGSYEYDDEDLAEVEGIRQYIIENYSEILKRENWENYMASVNSEFKKILESDPDFTLPEEKIQVLANFRLYEYYLNNIEPALRRFDIDENHLLYPLMEVVGSYSEFFISDKSQVTQLLTGWFNNKDAHFIRAAASFVSYQWQKERTAGSLANLEDFKERELDPYIYFESRNFDIDESQRLWDAAIDNIINGPDLRSARTFTFHQVEKGESIDLISEMYDASPFDVFYENRFNMEFASPGDKASMTSRLEYDSFWDIFEAGRNLALKNNQDIYIPGKEIYSENWLDQHENNQDLREFYINRYVYSNVEKMVARAFYDFVNKTDYVRNLEQDYGVQFDRLDFTIEDRSFFSNPRTGEIDHDFIDLYYRKTIR